MYNPLFVQVSIISSQNFWKIKQWLSVNWTGGGKPFSWASLALMLPLSSRVSLSCTHSFLHPNTCKRLLSRLAPCSNGMLWWSQKDGVNEGKANDFSAAKEEKHINSYLHIMPSGRYILQRWSINNLLCQKCDTLNKVKSTALTVSLKIISN